MYKASTIRLLPQEVMREYNMEIPLTVRCKSQHVKAIVQSHKYPLDVTNNYVNSCSKLKDEKSKDEQFIEAVISWLQFAEIHDRREQVSVAHAKTFEWMFASEIESEKPTTGFVDWLKYDSGIFWIKGKPGCGKSTLMKFITDHTKLYQYAKVWAGAKPLFIASFYFWNSGSHLQKSIAGMYRTLLCKILIEDKKYRFKHDSSEQASQDFAEDPKPVGSGKHVRDEETPARRAFPNWQPSFASTEPTLPTLSAAMKNLLGAKALQQRYLLLIDGLDEYDSVSVGMSKLADYMLEMTATSEVKLVVSSRPWIPFELAFAACPKIAVETLTRSDIAEYTHDRVYASAKQRALTEQESDEITTLTEDIVNDASGVFLWVTVALNVVLDGANNRDDLWTLRQRLSELPRELEDLYAHIIKRIPPHYKAEAFRYLAIAYHWLTNPPRGGHSLFLPATVSAIGAASNDVATSNQLAALGPDQLLKRTGDFPDRLKSRCLGLLECIDDRAKGATVSFLHKSVIEFLARVEVRKVVGSDLGTQFDVNVAILTGLITLVRQDCLTKDSDFGAIYEAFHFNRLAELSSGRAQTKLLQCLDKVMREYD